jgi:hypothetical protein
MLFKVSALAQRVLGATFGDLKRANLVLQEMKSLAVQGQARLRLISAGEDPVLVTYFDASLGTVSDLAAQRGEVHFIANPDVLTSIGSAGILEFHSNRISRVVRSSMAAECASMTGAAARLVYNLKLWDALRFGNLEVTPSWRNKDEREPGDGRPVPLRPRVRILPACE